MRFAVLTLAAVTSLSTPTLAQSSGSTMSGSTKQSTKAGTKTPIAATVKGKSTSAAKAPAPEAAAFKNKVRRVVFDTKCGNPAVSGSVGPADYLDNSDTGAKYSVTVEKRYRLKNGTTGTADEEYTSLAGGKKFIGCGARPFDPTYVELDRKVVGEVKQ